MLKDLLHWGQHAKFEQIHPWVYITIVIKPEDCKNLCYICTAINVGDWRFGGKTSGSHSEEQEYRNIEKLGTGSQECDKNNGKTANGGKIRYGQFKNKRRKLPESDIEAKIVKERVRSEVK